MIGDKQVRLFFSEAMERSARSWPSAYYWATDTLRAWIYSDQPSAATEIAEYLRPLPYPRTAGPLVRIVSVHHPGRFGQLVGVPGGKVIWAKRDVCYRRVDLDGLELFIHESPPLPRHVILRAGNDLLVLHEAVGEEAFRIPVRIIRELLLRELQGEGGLFMHAAAVVSAKGRAALILGEQGAGKSTLMWALAGKGSLYYIANDRCIIRRRGSALEVIGWPLSIRLGRGLVESPAALFPSVNLRRGENSKVDSIRFTPRVWAERTKVELTPREFESVTGKNIAAAGELSALLMPRLAVTSQDVRIVKVERETAMAEFRAGVTEPQDRDYLRGWLQTRPQSDQDVQSWIAEVLNASANIPAYSVTGSADQILKDPHILDIVSRDLR